MINEMDDGTVRKFATGATRDTAADKLDYEGFLSPLVLEEYARYMHRHRVQSDGSLRASDNWQKGMPRQEYMKSLFRHFLAAWKSHRGWVREGEPPIAESLCGVLFNAMGYLHELIHEDLVAGEIPMDAFEGRLDGSEGRLDQNDAPAEAEAAESALDWLKAKLGIAR